jgi:hypothetical protein
MATINFTLDTFYGEATDSIATVDVALCNYGSQVARIPGTALLADVTIKGVTPSTPPATFSFEVAGNDVIQPAGTYYTVTVRDGNGDIIQCNAYIFLDANTYNLNTEQPFDPSLPVPPLPPKIYNQLVTFPYQASVSADLSAATAFLFELAGDMTVTFTNVTPGNLYTFIVQQDATGDHKLTWANAVLNATAVNQLPNGMTIQTFVASADENLYPVGAGTYA